MANNVGGNIASGATLGASLGGSLGSALPGVGTVVGTLGGAVIGGVGGLVSGLLSNKPKRPVLSENPYTMAALNFAKNEYANKGLTGQDILENKLDNTTSTYINNGRASTNGNDFLSGLASTMGQRFAAQNDIAYKGALEDKQDLASLQGALANSAEDKNRVDNFNIVGGYQDQLARQKAEQEGLANGIGDFSSIITKASAGKRQAGLQDELFGTGDFAMGSRNINALPAATSAPLNIQGAGLSTPRYDPFLAKSYYDLSKPLGGTVKLF